MIFYTEAQRLQKDFSLGQKKVTFSSEVQKESNSCGGAKSMYVKLLLESY